MARYIQINADTSFFSFLLDDGGGITRSHTPISVAAGDREDSSEPNGGTQPDRSGEATSGKSPSSGTNGEEIRVEPSVINVEDRRESAPSKSDSSGSDERREGSVKRDESQTVDVVMKEVRAPPTEGQHDSDQPVVKPAEISGPDTLGAESAAAVA